ncbi:MAG: hypothetical protein WBV21_02340 [Desulfobacterales bacterium]
MLFHDIEDNPAGRVGGLGPVNLDAVLDALFLQLFQKLRQPAEGPFLDGVAENSELLKFVVISKDVEPFGFQAVHGRL